MSEWDGFLVGLVASFAAITLANTWVMMRFSDAIRAILDRVGRIEDRLPDDDDGR